MTEPLIVGRIGAPHGIRGWSQLISLTDPVTNILDYSPLLLEQGSGWQALDDVEFSRTGNKLLIRFGGHADRDVAEQLRGRRLGLAPGNLPAAASDEFYWRDLIGLKAVDPRGRELGTVTRLLDTPAHAVLVIAQPQGAAPASERVEEREEEPAEAGPDDGADAAAEVLVPFVEEFTGTVDLEAGTIIVDWPEFEGANPAGPGA